jgi:hypothetical protein
MGKNNTKKLKQERNEQYVRELRKKQAEKAFKKSFQKFSTQCNSGMCGFCNGCGCMCHGVN